MSRLTFSPELEITVNGQSLAEFIEEWGRQKGPVTRIEISESGVDVHFARKSPVQLEMGAVE
jgi:hypothetical protein